MEAKHHLFWPSQAAVSTRPLEGKKPRETTFARKSRPTQRADAGPYGTKPESPLGPHGRFLPGETRRAWFHPLVHGRAASNGLAGLQADPIFAQRSENASKQTTDRTAAPYAPA